MLFSEGRPCLSRAIFFPRINSSGWEDLYLTVLLDCNASEEPSWASLEYSTSGWASEAGSTSRSLSSEVLIAFGHPSSDGLLAYDLPASRPLAPDVSSNIQIFEKI